MAPGWSSGRGGPGVTDTVVDSAMPFAVERVPGDLAVAGATDEGLGNTTWVAALGPDVLIVDPERAAAPYLSVAQAISGGQVSSMVVADTHLHADFLSGAGELARHGAAPLMPAEANAAWPHRAVEHGESLDFGRWKLQVVPTPGHTPEHVAYLLLDSGRAAAVFTGGSLLVGAVARTDLIDPADTESLTRALWRSINRELLCLPDNVLVLPTHGAGSFCSAAGGSRRWSTIGDERRANPLLQLDEDSFVRAVLDSLGSFPPYFLRLRDLNRLGPRVFGALPLLRDLTAERVTELREQGVTIIDVRAMSEYAEAHIPGSLANTLRPQFVSWLGWLVEDPTAPLVFVTDAHTDRTELVRQCLNIGYENLAGAITVDAWRAAGGDLARTSVVATAEARHVVDVRQANEYAAGHVRGATHIELGSLERARSALPAAPLLVMCGHGERATTAASILEAAGHSDVAIAEGGPHDWAERTGETLET